MTAQRIDPGDLTRFVGDDAVGRLVEYFLSGRFTDGQFELLAGGGDRVGVADVFTSDDIVAVSLLGVRIPGEPALALLGDRDGTYTGLLHPHSRRRRSVGRRRGRHRAALARR